ncbi:hypothetical protein NEIG_00693 [Nematocida sp. ERTm5]|nr:hypothetical protein NEIG_00693 [Nematocida sp. ERTm5]
MFYPETDILVMWRLFNKISLSISVVNILYLIDREWGVLNYIEYLSVLAVVFVFVLERTSIYRHHSNRMLCIYLMHILFISPLFHHIFYKVRCMIYFGLILSACSFLLSFHSFINRFTSTFSALALSSEIDRIECASGFTIIFMLLQHGICKIHLANRHVYMLRAVSLSMNILLSNTSVFLSPCKISLWELFCTIIAPGVVIVLYQDKCKMRARRNNRRVPQKRKPLFLQDEKYSSIDET